MRPPDDEPGNVIVTDGVAENPEEAFKIVISACKRNKWSREAIIDGMIGAYGEVFNR